MSAKETQAIIVSIDAGVQTIFIIVCGAILKKKGFITDEGKKTVNNITINFLLPALLFTNMLESLSVSELADIGIILLFVIEHNTIGSLFGVGLGYLTKSDPEMRMLMGMCLAFQNATAIPLLYIEVLSDDSFTEEDHNFKEKGVAYVLIYSIFSSTFLWSYGFNMLTPREKKEEPLLPDDEELGAVSTTLNYERSSITSRPSAVSEQTADISTITEDPPKENCGTKCWAGLKKYVNMPVIAAVTAIPLSLIPGMTYVFKGNSAVLHGNLIAALKDAGGAAVVLILIILGQSLSKGFPKGATMSSFKVAVLLIARLFIMPIIGIGICYPLYTSGVIERPLALVIMLMHSCPTSA